LRTRCPDAGQLGPCVLQLVVGAGELLSLAARVSADVHHQAVPGRPVGKSDLQEGDCNLNRSGSHPVVTEGDDRDGQGHCSRSRRSCSRAVVLRNWPACIATAALTSARWGWHLAAASSACARSRSGRQPHSLQLAAADSYHLLPPHVRQSHLNGVTPGKEGDISDRRPDPHPPPDRHRDRLPGPDAGGGQGVLWWRDRVQRSGAGGLSVRVIGRGGRGGGQEQPALPRSAGRWARPRRHDD